MTSRQRVLDALNHRQPDRVPVDFGSTAVTGMHVTAVTRLRLAVLGDKGFRVKVIEPYQMLGEIDEPLRQAMGIDCVGLAGPATLFGFANSDWKPFTLFDGTEVLVPGEFNVRREADGSLVIFPEGDTSAPPSGRMPAGGNFFDTIVRQPPLDEEHLRVEDNTEEFAPLSEAQLAHYQRESDRLAATHQAVVMGLPGTAFGDIAMVPAPWMKNPRGIRDIEEWYVSTALREEHVHKIFQRQCEVGLANARKLIGLLGNRVDVAFVSGTDFGTQRGPFLSCDVYRRLYKPFHKQINDLVHRKSKWKTFMHSCGGVYPLIEEFIDAGFDILNPVQCSAEGMNPARLKKEFGSRIVFWGGGVDTQHTMAFGTPEQVYREVSERIEIFNADGGFVFDAIHNIQANTRVENLLAMFKAISGKP